MATLNLTIHHHLIDQCIIHVVLIHQPLIAHIDLLYWVHEHTLECLKELYVLQYVVTLLSLLQDPLLLLLQLLYVPIELLALQISLLDLHTIMAHVLLPHIYFLPVLILLVDLCLPEVLPHLLYLPEVPLDDLKVLLARSTLFVRQELNGLYIGEPVGSCLIEELDLVDLLLQQHLGLQDLSLHGLQGLSLLSLTLHQVLVPLVFGLQFLYVRGVLSWFLREETLRELQVQLIRVVVIRYG